MSLLHEAVKAGDLSRVALLVILGCPLDEVDDGNYYPLDYALDGGDAELLGYLLAQEAPSNVCGPPLALWRLREWTQVRLDTFARHADLRALDEDGETALHIAVASEENARVAVRVLLARGADPGLKSRQGETPLERARRKGAWGSAIEFTPWAGLSTEALKEAIRAGGQADPNSLPMLGLGGLHWAIWLQDLGLVKELLALGADVNLASYDGWTPLHIAAQYGDVETVQVLLGARRPDGLRGAGGPHCFPAAVRGRDAL